MLNQRAMNNLDYIYDDLPEMYDIPSDCIEDPNTRKCTCRKNVEWQWDNEYKSESVEILEDRLNVKFHRTYSNGTAVVRCTEPMIDDQYYWEVKMTGPVYGTDVMVGVGTCESSIRDVENRFVSLLGMDKTTWGYSYTGLFHHNGKRRCYAQNFSQGSTIGVHLDLWKGTLTFYKDRKSLGIASSGLKGKTLYAMAASTAARSQMRMVYSSSFPSSLQFLCCSKLREIVPDSLDVLDVIDLPPGLKNYLSVKLSWLLNKRQIEKNQNYCCRIIDPQRVLPSRHDHRRHERRDCSFVRDTVRRPYEDPFLPSVSRNFILFGNVLLQHRDRFQRAVRDHISEELEANYLNGDSKRRRFSQI